MAISEHGRARPGAPGSLKLPADQGGGDRSLVPASVVIVNHNAGRLLADCLEAALAQARQVILVDNASTPIPFEAVAARFATHPRLTILRSRVNTGFAAGCNLGAARADQPTLLFLNPDCILGPGSLAILHAALGSGERVGMVGGLLTDVGGREQGGARRSIPTPWRSFVRGFGLRRLAWLAPRWFSDFHLHREPLPAGPIEVEAVSGALTMVTHEAFAAAGPWDEGFFLHCEDLDLCLRFRQTGWKILFVPTAPAIHHRGLCGRSRPLAVEWHKHHGMIRFYRKHFRHTYPAGLFGLVVAGVWLRFTLVAIRQAARQAVAAAWMPGNRVPGDAAPAWNVREKVLDSRVVTPTTLPS
jgi:GT2 family glycosyltransferase